ncbi:MAG: peptidoglycan DD-metalloendopeptidase family protein [Actinomycetota bacterium]|nr:peptidoglycan DD-metalloendopeptidase family protein [Actinomycetota bacterium]
MPTGARHIRRTKLARIGAVAALFALTAVPLVAAGASGEEQSDLKSRMEAIQARLDAATAKVEELREEQDEVLHEINDIEARMGQLEESNEKLEKRVIARANAMYRTGSSGMVEVLFSADDFADLTTRAELMSRVSLDDSGVFVRLYRAEKELTALSTQLSDEKARLADTEVRMGAEAQRLQGEFDAVAAEYEELQAKLAAQAQAQAEAQAQAPSGAPSAPSAPQGPVRFTGGMTCPVAGPVSFVDSWGDPRAGHTHVGVDMMAAYGAPVVAITSGTITYAAFDGSGGNMIFLSGDDGNQYWYMHNQQNLVTGGHVSAGQQIATVGDTGNATGTPHVHFEYHPGGGAPVNPYPLVASLC